MNFRRSGHRPGDSWGALARPASEEAKAAAVELAPRALTERTA
jgi:hypothetical protein